MPKKKDPEYKIQKQLEDEQKIDIRDLEFFYEIGFMPKKTYERILEKDNLRKVICRKRKIRQKKS